MVLNPLVVPPFLMGLISYKLGVDYPSTMMLLGIALVMYTVLPLIYLVYLIKRGTIDELEARDRSKRSGPLFVGVGLLTVAIVPVYLVSSVFIQDVIGIVAVMIAINGFWIALITLRIKISIHVSSVAGFFSLILGLQTFEFIPQVIGPFWLVLALVLGIGLVSWARIVSDAHTKVEVLLGGLFGIFLPLFEIALLRVIL